MLKVSEVYTEQSEDFIKKGEEHKVCELRKSIYGLKTKRPELGTEIDGMLLTLGWKQSMANQCQIFLQLRKNLDLNGKWLNE